MKYAIEVVPSVTRISLIRKTPKNGAYDSAT